MVAIFALALSLVGSVLSEALLPPVVVNGLRVAPNVPSTFQAAPVRSFASATSFGSQPAFPPSPAFAPQPARAFQPSPALAPQPPRFQSDFAAPAQPSFGAPPPSFAAPPPTPFGAAPPQNFRFQNDFVAPSSHPIPGATVVNRLHQQDESGSYSSQFQTSDGQSVSEVGTAKATPDGLDTIVTKQGHFSYTSPQGIPVAVSYVADENGFRVSSDNLPK